MNLIQLESNIFFVDNSLNISTDNYDTEELCLIRTNENMLNMASDNQSYLDIPCLPPLAFGSPPEGSVCWTAGWGDYRTTDDNGVLTYYHNQEQS